MFVINDLTLDRLSQFSEVLASLNMISLSEFCNILGSNSSACFGILSDSHHE